MTEYKYTVAAIDRLRSVCKTRWLYGTTNLDGLTHRMSRQFREGEKTKAVEEMVRTYMLAGITAEDILEQDNPKK